jgi:hypothetical protein
LVSRQAGDELVEFPALCSGASQRLIAGLLLGADRGVQEAS